MYAKGEMVPGYGPMMVQPPPPSPYGAEVDLTRAVQVQLIRLGYMRGAADGVAGPQTATAISQFESVSGLPVDGYPSPPLLAQAAGDAIARPPGLIPGRPSSSRRNWPI